MILEIKPFTSPWPDPMPGDFPSHYGQGEVIPHAGTPVRFIERKPVDGDGEDPFVVDAFTNPADPEKFQCTITRGVVIDHQTDDLDAVVELEVDNQFDHGSDAPDDGLARFDVVDGSIVYVKVPCDQYGRAGCDLTHFVTGSIAITIWNPGDLADSCKSVHYIPPVGSDPGAGGVSFYRLADIEIVDGEVKVKPAWCMGDNIAYYRDRAAFKAPGTDGADIFNDYSPSDEAYRYKLIRGKDMTSVTPPTGYQNVVVHVDVVPQGGGGPASGFPVIEVKADPIPLPPDPTVDTVTLVEERAVDPQVHVASRAPTGPETAAGFSKAFTVRGNGANGSLSFAKYPDAPVLLMSWDDGLVTTHGDILVELTFDGSMIITVTGGGSSSSA